MKKTFLWAATAIAAIAAFATACKDNLEPAAPTGRMVDVVFEMDRNEFGNALTRLVVSPGGVTRWSPGDQVVLIDYDEGRTGRMFTYLPRTARSTGTFSGRLMAGMGPRLYYAYHSPAEAGGFHQGSMVLTVGRQDMRIVENGQNFNTVYGKHCAMVAIPKEFDASDPDSDKRLQFHHVNCLIEASIATKPSDGRLREVMFDVVEFRLTADDGQRPFSTAVSLDMTQIVPPPAVAIPYADFDESKTDHMLTWIEYDQTKRLGDLIANGAATTNYGIPIFALPTTSTFGSTATVNFWRHAGEVDGEPQPDELVLTLQKHSCSDTRGLNLSGLNIINFDETDIVFIL